MAIEAAPAAESAALVVFDFDGTLVRGDCGHAFVRSLLWRQPWRMPFAFLVAPLGLPLLATANGRRLGVSMFLWIATLGTSRDRLRQRAANFAKDYRLSRIEPAWHALQTDLARGHRVVIATGALRWLAEDLLARLQLQGRVELVASELRPWLGGFVCRVQCNGRDKTRHLQQSGFAPPYLRAYSDTWSDRALLDLAQTPVLVNARADLLQKFRDRYGPRLRHTATR